MGDARRFDLFADLVSEHLPARTMNLVDVASGKGYLQAALRQRGYQNITSWDKRPRNAKTRRGYHYGYFDYRSAPIAYDAAIGMHPDEGTDHIIMYACRRRIPFIVCPCCVKPSASKFQDIGYDGWIRHLVGLADAGQMQTVVTRLPMKGRNVVIIGTPA